MADYYIIRPESGVSKTSAFEIDDNLVKLSLDSNKPILIDSRSAVDLRVRLIGFMHTSVGNIREVIIYPMSGAVIDIKDAVEYASNYKEVLIRQMFNLFKYSIAPEQIKVFPIEKVIQSMTPDTFEFTTLRLMLRQSKKVNLNISSRFVNKQFVNHMGPRLLSFNLSIEELSTVEALIPALTKKLKIPLSKMERIRSYFEDKEELWNYFEIGGKPEWSVTDVGRILTVVNNKLDYQKLNELSEAKQTWVDFDIFRNLIDDVQSKIPMPEKSAPDSMQHNITCEGVSLILSARRKTINFGTNIIKIDDDYDRSLLWFSYLTYMGKIDEVTAKLKRIILLNI